ncbi:MAG: HupE/UreJ family protein [Cellvibrionaceae bacterium]
MLTKKIPLLRRPIHIVVNALMNHLKQQQQLQLQQRYLPVLMLLMASAFSFLFSNLSFAHDAPAKVMLHIYVKPSGTQLHVLMRVPMEALGEIDFPKRGPGYLDFSQGDQAIYDAAEVYLTNSFVMIEEGENLQTHEVKAARIDLPSDRSFASFDLALKNVQAPRLNDSVNLMWSQGVLDVLVSYPIQSENSQFSFVSSLDRLGEETNTVLRYILPDGTERVFNYYGNPGEINLDPSFLNAFITFISLGFDHILDGIDHLLFLFCLVIPIRKLRSLIPVVTAFTVAHSITLMSALFGMVPNVIWFAPLIETLIALSIVYMAFENIFGFSLKDRWMVTFGFGLIHGFGFSFLLTDSMQFAGNHLFSALLAFNVGVEVGQLFVLALALPVLVLFFRLINSKERIGIILLSGLVAHQAWHWMIDRGGNLLEYSFEWPDFNILFVATLMRWGMLLIVIFIVGWLLSSLFKRFSLVNNADTKRDPHPEK